MSTNRLRQLILFIIPVLYLVWSLQLNLLGGPYSLSRSDPEYPYLLNGLNCATLNFHNIGHTDHPGTPFQMLTGLFIRATHILVGQGPITQDVISRPELYLSFSSLFLSMLTFLLIFWLGRLAMKTHGKMMGVVILQSSFLLSAVLIDMPIRYNPDRILILYSLVLAGITIKYLFTENYTARLYAILSGILMGVGFATKFNFLPVLIIPLLLIPDIRNRLIYTASIAGAFIISVLPILDKFKEFRRFISGVVSHDGLYGAGSQQVINWKSFIHNFGELLTNNPAFTMILILSIGLIAAHYLRKMNTGADNRQILLLIGFIAASVIGFILVSKHFKVYYFAPVLSLCGLALFIIWNLARPLIKSDKIHNYSSAIILTLLILLSVMPLPAQYRSRVVQKNANLKTSEFYAGHITKKDFLFIEPTWLAGPVVENALVYGMSYVAGRQIYYPECSRLYPNILTYEGADQNPGLFRTALADPESILFSGRDIFLFSSPGRNAGQMLTYMQILARKYGTQFRADTLFSNPSNEDRVIRIRNSENWTTLLEVQELQDKKELSPAAPVSREIPITDIRAGDYLEVTVRILSNDQEAGCRLIARSLQSDQDGIYFEDSGSLQDIGHGWKLLRLRGKIGASPADAKMICQAYYPGKNKVTIQDFQIRHMGRR
ncbi:MAG: hypothetical protein WCW62_03840 [Bacteroidales bacterium]